MSNTFCKSFFTVFLLFTSAVQARWGTLADADVEVLFEHQDLTIHADGSSETMVEQRVKILREDGRAQFANYSMTYTEHLQTVKILEAKTIYQGNGYHLSPHQIEDKHLASSQSGFDEKRQILMSFPHAEIGAEIYLKYKVKSKAILKNNYEGLFVYGQTYTKNLRLKVHSAIPLRVKLNDPQNVWELTPLKHDGVRHFTLSLKKPLCQFAIKEPENNDINPKKITWLSVSSFQSWEDLARFLAPPYEKVMAQKLPDLFQAIFEKVRNIKDEVEQINTVTSLVNHSIHYMGDWRSINGKFFPRDLSKIAELRTADCKEFTSVTGAILQKLGFQVQPALVMRGTNNFSWEDVLPTLSNSNHVFLKVTNKQGKVYWVDPTNRLSMAEGIFEDVADKQVLILDGEHPSYEKSPSINPEHSKIIMEKRLKIHENGDITTMGTLQLLGEQAAVWHYFAFDRSPQTLQDGFFYMLSGEHLEDGEKQKLVLPSFESRIIKNINISFQYTQKNKLLKTNLGSGLPIAGGFVQEVMASIPDQVSDLLLESPNSFQRHTILENVHIQDVERLNYQRSTPWVDVKRSCYYEGDNTVILDESTTKKTRITQEELQTETYKDLRKELKENVEDCAVILPT